MRSTTIEDRFLLFLELPSVERLMAVREQLLQHEDFEPYAPFWSRLARRFDEHRFQDVVQACTQHQHVGCLSPRFHFFWGIAASELGDQSVAQTAKATMQSLLRTLLETGDGRPDTPFLCTYMWDAYDVLRVLGVEPNRQQMVASDDQRFDVVTCANGEEFWFDVSDLVPAAPAAPSTSESVRTVAPG